MLPRLVSCVCLAVCAFAAGCCHDVLHCGDACGAGPFGGCLKDGLTCQAGCGEVYVDEWLSDPPDHCDPCDDCGNYVGHGHGHHLLGFLHKLWGYRYVPSGCGPAAGYHGYADAIAHAGPPHGPYAADIMLEGDVHGGPMPHAEPMGEGFYEVGPGETVVPGSVKITEGGMAGEPTPAQMPTPAPHVLPGPSASKSRGSSPHRQTGYRSPRRRPQTR